MSEEEEEIYYSKDQILELVSELIPDGRSVKCVDLTFLLDNGCLSNFTDGQRDYYKFIGILEEVQFNIMSDMKEENKARLNNMME